MKQQPMRRNRFKPSRWQQVQQRIIDWLLDLDAEDVFAILLAIVIVIVIAIIVNYIPQQEYRVYIPST